MATIAAQGVMPTGPWFTHHLAMVPDTWDFEISVPVSAPIVAAGRVEPGRWPAMKAARAVYHGPYEGLADAWGEFMDWIEAKGHRSAPDLYECYVAGPESSPDPATWRTEFTKTIGQLRSPSPCPFEYDGVTCHEDSEDNLSHPAIDGLGKKWLDGRERPGTARSG
jgi:effector-binding domain-containing protein